MRRVLSRPWRAKDGSTFSFPVALVAFALYDTALNASHILPCLYYSTWHPVIPMHV